MTDASAWAAAADPGRRLGHAVEHHASLGSTNDRASELLAAGVAGTAVVADHQTAGRGRRGRRWASAAGRDLAVSVGFHPRLAAGSAGLLSIAAALAIRDACAEMVPGVELRVRWPNDIVTAGGAKLAGLLIETAAEEDRLVEAVIGMGVNVNWRPAEMPAEIAERATSLAELSGHDLDRVALLARLLDRLDREVAALEAGSSPVERMREVSALEGSDVVVDVGEQVLAGRVAGIGPDGALLLDVEAGRVALTSGEVVTVRDPAAVRT